MFLELESGILFMDIMVCHGLTTPFKTLQFHLVSSQWMTTTPILVVQTQ